MSFSGVTFKTFVVICSLAQRINEAAPAVGSSITSLDKSGLAANLKGARSLFYFHVRGKQRETVTALRSSTNR